MCKFRESGNKGLRERLLGTGERMIVEASPLDRIWGIGFGERRALEVGRGRWGLNLLGLALMDTRRILREERESRTSHVSVRGGGSSERWVRPKEDVVMEETEDDKLAV